MNADLRTPLLDKSPIGEGKVPSRPEWGRHAKASYLDATYAASVMLFCPSLVILVYVAINQFDGSLLDLTKAVIEFAQQGSWKSVSRMPPLDIASLMEGLGIYIAWVCFQVVLYRFLPGKISRGQITPAGHILDYKVNGLLAWFLSNSLFLLGGWFGFWKLSVVANHWGCLLLWANVYGYVLTLFAYFKARWNPTHVNDRKFSGASRRGIFAERQAPSFTTFTWVLS